MADGTEIEYCHETKQFRPADKSYEELKGNAIIYVTIRDIIWWRDLRRIEREDKSDAATVDDL
mgnify:CR=1 FL=1